MQGWERAINTLSVRRTQPDSTNKEDLCIEAQQRGKKFALIIKSSLFEGIFIDATRVNFVSLETARAKKYFL